MTFQLDSTGLGQGAHLPLFPGYPIWTILACEQALCLGKDEKIARREKGKARDFSPFPQTESLFTC